MTIKAYGFNSSKGIKNAEHKIKQIEKLISTTDTQSEIYRFNNFEPIKDCQFEFSEESWNLIKNTIEFSKLTNGALNPCLFPITKEWGFTTKNYHVPENSKIDQLLKFTDWTKLQILDENKILKSYKTEIDLGAVGKGYAGDEAIKQLKNAGVKSAILDLGGNIQCIGTKPDGKEWQIGLRNPWGTSPVAALKINNKAVITSGGYERYFTADDGNKYIHIFDGKTGKPVSNNLVSVTIITDSGFTGDALSTAIFVMGKENAIEFWKQNQKLNFEMILICQDNSIIYTEGLSSKIQLLEDFKTVEIINK